MKTSLYDQKSNWAKILRIGLNKMRMQFNQNSFYLLFKEEEKKRKIIMPAKSKNASKRNTLNNDLIYNTTSTYLHFLFGFGFRVCFHFFNFNGKVIVQTQHTRSSTSILHLFFL